MTGVEIRWRPPAEIASTVLVAARPQLDRLAAAVVDDARRLVPVDTGALRGTIRSTVDADTGTIVVSAGDATVDYAAHVEYGTSRGPAQPYLRPAVHKNRGVIR